MGDQAPRVWYFGWRQESATARCGCTTACAISSHWVASTSFAGGGSCATPVVACVRLFAICVWPPSPRCLAHGRARPAGRPVRAHGAVAV